jgi:hypothetical protein
VGGTISHAAVNKFKNKTFYTAMEKILTAVEKIKQQTTLQSQLTKH